MPLTSIIPLRTSPPAPEAPVRLRAARELSGFPAPRPPVALPAAESSSSMLPFSGQARPHASGDSGLAAITATMTAFAVIAGIGWAVERRRRLARPVAVHPGSAVEFEPANLPASQLEDFALPGFAASAPALHSERFSTGLSRQSRKKLIRLSFWLRSAAAAAAVLSAIAVVVFQAIEFTDVGAGDTGLTVPLLFLVVAGWAGYWGCGRLANLLHRSLFNRDHPKFAD